MDTSNLPLEFLDRMKVILKEEYDDFLLSYKKDTQKGLRINTLKTEDEKELPFSLKPIYWCKEGYYYNEKEYPGKNVLHEMGLYYIQEPSAMAVCEELDIKPGEYILDLCAAPGGKSTQIAAKLKGEGLLVSNEIVPQRAKILSSNIERMGITNCIVTNESPERLVKFFKKFFDKILVDAPCSGEGMFKKNPIAIDEWSKENVLMCRDRQLNILDSASKMLKDGGKIVFSTCTFSYDENEGVIQEFLNKNKDFKISESKNKFSPGLYREDLGLYDEQLKLTQRIYPHKVDGEGHYFAILENTNNKENINIKLKDIKVPKEYLEFQSKALNVLIKPNVIFGRNLYMSPLQNINGLKIERCGLHLGEIKKNRFEPSHSLALALKPQDFKNNLDLTNKENELEKYMSGDTIEWDKKGWGVVVYKGHNVGLIKGDGIWAKNHYPKGLRK